MKAAGPILSVLVVLGVAILTACGAVGPPPPPVDGAFPVTVDHAHGETEVRTVPRRVVALGDTDQDALLALGIVPVAVMDDAGSGSTSTRPWWRSRVRGSAPVELKAPADAADVEPIRALRPDLVLSVSRGWAGDGYDIGAAVAPTIGSPPGLDDDVSVPWQDTTRLIGRAVGKAATADRLVTAAEARMTRTASRYPQLAGATGACVQSSGRADGVYEVDAPSGTCPRFLASLGLRSVPSLDRAAEDDDGLRGISVAQIAGPDRPDVVVLNGLSADPREAARLGLPRDLPVVTLSDDEAAAVRYASVLGLPPAADSIAPKLARAIG